MKRRGLRASLPRRICACLALAACLLTAGAASRPVYTHAAESSVIETVSITFKSAYGEPEEIIDPVITAGSGNYSLGDIQYRTDYEKWKPGKKVRVAGFGDPEAGEELGFYLVFDGTPRQDSRLTALLFSEIEPRSLAENAAAFQRIQGRTAEAYCYLNSLTGVQLTGTLEAGDDGLRLLVRRIRLSGRKKEIFLK